MSEEGSLILIAEDDPVSAKILANTCKSLGHIPIVCSDGKRAFYVLEDNPDIPLLITDMVMPDMDGELLIRTLRSRDHFKDLPIIIVSGMVSVKEIKGILDLGASYFLPKPIPIEEIKQYITKSLDRSS